MRKNLVPGGGLENDETPVDCCVREVHHAQRITSVESSKRTETKLIANRLLQRV